MGFKFFTKSIFSSETARRPAMFASAARARKCGTLMLGLAAAALFAAPSLAGTANFASRLSGDGTGAPWQETELCQYCHASRNPSNRLLGNMTEASCLFYGEKVIGKVKCSSCHEPICRHPQRPLPPAESSPTSADISEERGRAYWT